MLIVLGSQSHQVPAEFYFDPCFRPWDSSSGLELSFTQQGASKTLPQLFLGITSIYLCGWGGAQELSAHAHILGWSFSTNPGKQTSKVMCDSPLR